MRGLTFVISLLTAWSCFATPYKPGAVIYGVVPTLFGSEPPLRAVINHLDRLQNLGVDVLWLSPIYETDDLSDISYSVTNFFKIRSDFGSPEDFRALVKGAHRRGMQVILDFVPNHTSREHPFFQDAQRKGRNSEFWNFHQRTSDGNAVYYFDWEHLPNINYDNRDAVNHIVKAFEYWIREFHVDGFRIDVAWGVRERAPWFWPKLRNHLDPKHQNIIMLAEGSAQDPYFVQNGFDLAYDWTEKLGHWAWDSSFKDVKHIGHRLHEALTSTTSPKNTVARFLNNNDTGKRFITRYGPQMQRLGAVLQFTAPGIPILYTGDEVGAEFLPYDDPREIEWTDRYRLTPLYRWLSQLREMSAAFYDGEFESLPALNTATAYAYARWNNRENSWAIPVLNFGTLAKVEFAWPKELKDFASEELCDVLNLREIRIELENGHAKVPLQEQSAVILTRKSACETLRRQFN